MEMVSRAQHNELQENFKAQSEQLKSLVTQIARLSDQLATCEWLAWFIWSRHALLLPMDRIRRDLKEKATKHSEPLVNKLASFSGILVADAEHRHNPLFKDGRIIEAGCNAHGRRKLRDAEQHQPVLAAEGGRFISAAFEAEAKAKELALAGDALRAWRRENCAPHFAEFEAWSEVVKPTLLPSDPLNKVLAYYKNHWDALLRFLDYPQIPIDNSATERLYQPVAKLRHNILFAGSTEGAHRLATLLGIVASCRAQGVNGEAYLAWVFTRLGTHRERYQLSAAQLTPAAYAARAGPESSD